MAQPRQNPFEQGPYVQVAAFCETVLREGNGVLSLIRIVDVITHTARGPDAPAEMPSVRYPLNLVLALKPGRARGRHEIKIVPERPSGEAMPANTMSVHMEGEARGVNVVARMDVPYDLEGLYWFQVWFDGDVLTRLPLQVRYARFASGSTSQPPR